LYPRLGQIKLLKHSRVQGETGSLAMDEYGQIIRTLPFAKFKKGLAIKTQGYVENVETQSGI
jgi:outer membrane PBP1 activator LpoA protein